MDKFLTANAILSIFSKNYMELKKGLPIRPSEMGVLNIITETAGPHTPVMLAELLGVSKPMITAHLTSLTNKGYIVKQPSAEDKRVYYILPTHAGVELANKAKADIQNQLKHLETGMGEEDFHRFVTLAQKANEIMEKRENGES